MGASPAVLLVEDNLAIAAALAVALKNEYRVDRAASGGLGLARAREIAYDVIVLDLGLPDMSGLEVCRRLRRHDATTPILVLTADMNVLTKINLLDAGANDYLTKPFSLGELKARLRVQLRRRAGEPAGGRLEHYGLILDPHAQLVRRGGQTIRLRRKEFALLECLMINAGNVVSYDSLGYYAWRGSDSPFSNTLQVHIKHLRDKVDAPFGESLIKTVHGIGYQLEATKGQAAAEHQLTLAA